MDNVTEISEEDKTIEELKKDHSDKIKKLEEVLLNYIGENDPKLLKTNFPDKSKYLTKNLAYYQLYWWLSKTCWYFTERRVLQYIKKCLSWW